MCVCVCVCVCVCMCVCEIQKNTIKCIKYIVDAEIDSELICSRMLKLLSFMPLIHKVIVQINIFQIKINQPQKQSILGRLADHHRVFLYNLAHFSVFQNKGPESTWYRIDSWICRLCMCMCICMCSYVCISIIVYMCICIRTLREESS